MASPETNLSRDLDHVRWIGGTSCSGKTTYARMLAQRHPLQLYEYDERQEDYLRRATPEKHPTLYAAGQRRAEWAAWYRQSPQTLFDLARREAYEAFGFVLDDLAQMPRVPSVVVEGIGLYPELLAAVTRAEQVILLVADEALARKIWEDRYRQTPWLAGYANPQEIVESFIRWTCLSAEYLQRTAARFGITCWVSTLETPMPERFQALEAHLGFA